MSTSIISHVHAVVLKDFLVWELSAEGYHTCTHHETNVEFKRNVFDPAIRAQTLDVPFLPRGTAGPEEDSK